MSKDIVDRLLVRYRYAIAIDPLLSTDEMCIVHLHTAAFAIHLRCSCSTQRMRRRTGMYDS
jgi:hypothetical protein